MKAKKPFIVTKDNYGTVEIVERCKDLIDATRAVEYELDNEMMTDPEEAQGKLDDFKIFKVGNPVKSLTKGKKGNRYLVFDHDGAVVVDDATYTVALEEIKKTCVYEHDTDTIIWDKFEIYVNPKVYDLSCETELRFDVSAN
jgi:hypothetical protein